MTSISNSCHNNDRSVFGTVSLSQLTQVIFQIFCYMIRLFPNWIVFACPCMIEIRQQGRTVDRVLLLRWNSAPELMAESIFCNLPSPSSPLPNTPQLLKSQITFLLFPNFLYGAISPHKREIPVSRRKVQNLQNPPSKNNNNNAI